MDSVMSDNLGLGMRRGAESQAAACPTAVATPDSSTASGSAEKPSLLARMREDVDAVIARDPSAESRTDVAFFSPGLHAIWAHRAQHRLWERGHHKLAELWEMHTRRRTGIEIHPAATIGRRFVIDHGMGIVIGGTAIIGDDCLIYHGVTLGMTGKHGGKRHPTLGNNVVVGAGAKVLGNIYLADNCKIGAGAVVLHDVPEGATAVGVPARLVHCRQEGGNSQLLKLAYSQSQQLPLSGEENINWSCAL